MQLISSFFLCTMTSDSKLMSTSHLLLWIRGCLSPQEIRNHILDPESDFKRQLVAYLESAHIGDFLTGSQDKVTDQVNMSMQSDGYLDPTQTLPVPPPSGCNQLCGKCEQCKSFVDWCTAYQNEVDDLILKSNVHRCSDTTSADKQGGRARPHRYVGCIETTTGKCKARFPRPIVEKTEVDPETGAISMKKLEPMINTVTPQLTYLLHCNTDVTSLKSGTAIKAVVMYVTDYITT